MKEKPKMVLLLLALSQFLVVLDSAIINVALPAIKQALNFDTSSLQWVITAYILTFGGFLMLGGRTADLFGRRKVLVGGMIGFTALSLLLGLTQDSTTLIVLRALQGLTAAFMSPAALSILLTTFAKEEERNKALSIWSIVGSGGAAVGVFLGGLITQTLGWEWCFFVNVPVGIITILGILKYVPVDQKGTASKHLDLPGAVLITLGLMTLVFGLTQAPESGWFSSAVITPLVASAAMIALFIWNETRAKHPLIPLAIFKQRNITGANLVMLTFVAGGLGLFFFASLFVQNILNYSPILSGLCFLPIPILIGVVSTHAPKLIGRFGIKPLLIVGAGLVALAMFILSFLTAESSYWLHLLPAFVLMGVGMGLSFVSITISATAGVPPEQAGLASGLINTSNQVGAALGVAVLAVVASATANAGLAAGQAPVIATMHGYQQAFFWASIFLIIALIIASLVIQSPKNTKSSAPISTH
ncbi:MAG TPA: MFS transporter [Candidatus Saccharimonadales bacterium]|nr:MFS transporter [Candidatus Saccharimonadales bacterium]